MIYVLTIRNKSGLIVKYRGVPINKLVFEFSVAAADQAGEAIRGILSDVVAEDPYLHRCIEEADDDSWDEDYKHAYNNSVSGFLIDWKVVDGVN